MKSANSLSHVEIGILPVLVRHYILRCSVGRQEKPATDMDRETRFFAALRKAVCPD